MLKKIFLFLLFIISIMIFSFKYVSAAGNTGSGGTSSSQGYIKMSLDKKELIVCAYSNYSDSGIKYKTVGWKFRLDAGGTTYYGIKRYDDSDSGSGLQSVTFHIPFAGDKGTDTIQGILESKYTSNQDFINISQCIAQGSHIYLDAGVIVVKYGVPQGGINSDGSIKPNVYFTYPGIIDSISPLSWSTDTQNALHSYFGLDYSFPAQLVPCQAKITGPTSYKVGDTISLSGASSYYPPNVTTKYVTWKYRQHGTASWTTLVDSGHAVFVPSFPALTRGSYDVSLEVWYDNHKDYGDSTTTTITLVDDADVIDTPVANPEKTLFKNSNIDVTVTVKGTIKNVTDITKISKWIIYSKAHDSSTWISYTLPRGLTASKDFYYTIPKGAITGEDFTQVFDTKVEVYLTDGTKKSDSVPCSTYVYKTVPLPPAPSVSPPVVIITAPATVMAGDTVSISGLSSYATTPGATMDWSNPMWNIEGTTDTITGGIGPVCWNTEGTYNIQLLAFDTNGVGNIDKKSIVVTPPIPKADFIVFGKRKSCRIVGFDSSPSHCSPLAPINDSLTTYSIMPVTGTGAKNDYYVVTALDTTGMPIGNPYSGPLKGYSIQKVVFKSAGDYDITLTVTNSRGNSDTITKRITIKPDDPPIADFSTTTIMLRDPNDSDFATIILNDNSYSPDNDPIKQRIWRYKYDSDNDGNFDDENWVTIDNANLTQVTLKVPNVGRYKFDLQVIEDIIP